MLGRYVARFRDKLAVIDDIVGPRAVEPRDDEPAGAAARAWSARRAPSRPPARRSCDKLNAAPEAPPPPSYTVVSTRYDEVVTPYRSQALEGATNVVLQDRCPEDVTDHVGIIYDPIALAVDPERARAARARRPGVRAACAATPGRAALPFAFAAARRARRSPASDAGVRVACTRPVGRCVGRVLRCATAPGRLGSAPFDLAAGSTRTDPRAAAAAAARARDGARVVTLQPGG